MIRFLTIDIEGFGAFGGAAALSLEDRGLLLVRGENQDTRSASSNGAGKSTIFKAISWALFGQTIDGLKTNVVAVGSKKASVYLRFKVGPEEYAITRSRSSKSDLKLEAFYGGGWVDKSQGIRETQESIEALLGLDWDAFRCVCLFGQGDTSRFASPTMGDTARKAVLQRVLNLARYERARDEARNRRELVNLDIDKLNGELRTAEKDAASVSMAIDMRERDIVEAEETVANADEDVLAAKESLEEAREELRLALAAEPVASDALAAALADEKSLVEMKDAALAAMNKAGATCNATRAKHLALAEDECPTCGSPYDVDEDERASIADMLLVHRAKSDRAHDIFQEVLSELEDACGETKLARAEAERTRLRKMNCEARVEAREQDLGKLDGRADEAIRRASKLKSESTKLCAELAELIAQGDFLTNAIDEIAKQVRALDWWVKGLGPKGVQAYAIEQALPALNAHTNRHLLALSDGDLIVSWSATTMGTSGSEKEELTCSVTVEGFEDVQPSGGQWRKIELATELALAEVVAEAGGPRTNLLLLDEALDGLDEEGAARVCSWLAELDYESVFVISHQEAVSDSFERSITVVKSGGIATIEED